MSIATPYRLGAVLLCGLLVHSFTNPALAESPDDTPLFTEPPPPQQLADLLFGARYRSGGMFGMQIRFEFDSTQIKAESLPLLDSVGEMLKLPQSVGRSIVVEGHTDSIGSADYNQDLSERRARAVISYISDSYDVATDRFTASGKGERELLDVAQPKAPANRRAVFRATQKLRLK